jgi:hypothetical protein
MKRILAALAALALANVAIPLPAQASAATDCANLAGVGSSADPFLIATQADLMAVSTCNTAAGGGAHFEQTENIVLQGDWVPLATFDGSYDGNHFSISGLNINDTNQGLAGLFESLDGATVQNLTIVANDLIAESYAGAVAGYVENAVIENVRAKTTGTIDVIYGGGCLIGMAAGTLALTDVLGDCNTDASVRWAGGLVAYLGATGYPMTDLTITNAYVRGNLNFSEDGGGVAAILTSTDPDAQISGFTFAGNLQAPNSENALVGGIFGSASADGPTVPKTTITNSSIRGTISSLLVTEDPAPPQITPPPPLELAESSNSFKIATAVDRDTTPFNPSATVGKVYTDGGAKPAFVLSNMILAPKYGTPTGSDGYQVNVGTPGTKGLPAPSCVFHTEPPTASFEYNQTANLTLMSLLQIRDAATFAGCLDVVDGAENVTDADHWFKSTNIMGGEVWGAQFPRLGLHESTLNYGQSSFEIAPDEAFVILNSGWNFFPEFTISPALPAGVTLESHTGRIVGSANEQFGPTTFTVTRTSLFGHPNQTTSITLSQRVASASASAGAYQGPIIESLSPNPVAQGEEVVIKGSRLEQIDRVTLGSTVVEAADLTKSADELSFIVPLETETGQQSINFSGSFGSLSLQGGISVTAAESFGAQALRFEIRELANGDVKLYAFGVVNRGKVQFMVDGQELAWVRASNNLDPKLRSISSPSGVDHYLVRTIRNPGDQSIEFHLNGQLVQSRD